MNKTKQKTGKRLSLDQFKSTAVKKEQTQELEKLTGGVLGSCHTAADKLNEYLDRVIDSFPTIWS